MSGILTHLIEFSKTSYGKKKASGSGVDLISSSSALTNNQITPKEIKIEVAYFILKAYVTSNEAVIMIFANQGYKILGQFLSFDRFEDNKLLIFMAIDVFLLHFDQSIQSILLPQAELTTIFTEEGVPEKLAKIVPHLIAAVEADCSQKLPKNSDDDPSVSLKYVDKAFDLLQHLLRGSDEARLRVCSKEVFQDCLVKHAIRLAREPVAFSQTLIRKFMKLVQSLMAPPVSEKLLEKLFQVGTVVSLVEILKFYFKDIEAIEMTLIYDNLKLLNSICSHSRARMQQAAQCGLVQTLKQILVHILKLNDQFSSNKKIKLFKQILVLLLTNVKLGSDFSRVEMLTFEVHLVLVQILVASMTSLRQYAQNCAQLANALGDSQREMIKQQHLYSKVEKDHEINQRVVEIITEWACLPKVVQLDRLDKSLVSHRFLNLLVDISCLA